MTLIPEYDNYKTGERLRADPVLAIANSNELLIQRGLIDGASIVHKFGRNPSVGNGTWEGVWEYGGAFNFLTAATTVKIAAGGNVNDTAAGSGAQSVKIDGLDETGAFATETVATAGSSASASTTTTFIRVFRATVVAVGTYGGSNTGVIDITPTSAATELLYIGAGEGQTEHCQYTVPLGYDGYVIGLSVEADGSKAADFRVMTRENILTTTGAMSPVRLRWFFDGVTGLFSTSTASPIMHLPPLTDIWVEAEGSGATTECGADMEINLFAQ